MVLPHSCFIYDAIYHTSLDHVILTAGYDKLVYIWTVRSNESRYGQVFYVADSSMNNDLLCSACTRCVVMKDT